MSTLEVSGIRAPGAADNAITLNPDGSLNIVGNRNGLALDAIHRQVFSGATSVNVDYVFSNAYDNYVIAIEGSASVSGAVYYQMRRTGTNAATNYVNRVIQNDGTLSAQAGVATHGLIGTWSTGFVSGMLHVLKPYNLVQTRTTVDIVASDNGTSAWSSVGGSVHTTAQSYDGISILPASGTISGVVTIYGYQTQPDYVPTVPTVTTLDLYDYGDEKTSITNGWSQGYATGGSVAKNATSLQLNSPATNSIGPGWATNVPIDMTNYSRLYFRLAVIDGTNYSGFSASAARTTHPTATGLPNYSISQTTNIGIVQDLWVDITPANSAYFPIIVATGDNFSMNGGTTLIYKVWLE